MDVTKVEIRTNQSYQIEFNNNGGHQKIIATDVSDFICTNTADWISFSHNGNELEIIVLPNKSNVERTTDIYLKSNFYYNSYAIIVITQGETTYSIDVTDSSKKSVSKIEGIKVYNNGETETKILSVTVDGATKRCIVKGIKQYITEDNDTYLTTFDNAIKVKLIQTGNDGFYKLQLLNYGKVTSGKTYYQLTLCHKDNIDTEHKITISYEDETTNVTKLIVNDIAVSAAELKFDYTGYCGNSIVKLFTTKETVSFSTTQDWLYCRLGFDCIKVFADYNENTSARSGTITINDTCTITVTQAKKEVNTVSYDDSIAVASLEEDYIVDDTPAIELLSINGNTIECKTYIYNSHTDEYDNDSMISVNATAKWMHYKTAYDFDRHIHIVTLSAEENIWLPDRKCSVYIKNVEDNYMPIMLSITQSYKEDALQIESN